MERQEEELNSRVARDKAQAVLDKIKQRQVGKRFVEVTIPGGHKEIEENKYYRLIDSDTCPACRDRLIHTGGCKVCRVCGWSVCEN